MRGEGSRLRPLSALRRKSRAPCWPQLLFLPAGVLAVHQLRYLLAYGSDAGSELSAHGDRYVATSAIVVGTLVAIALVAGLLRLVAASRGRAQPAMSNTPTWLLWLGLTVLLIAGFWALEALEAAFEPQHPGGLESAFGDGGSWALPAAAAVAAVMTLFARGGRALLAVAARGGRIQRGRTTARWRPHAHPEVLVLPAMASCAPGRAPPFSQLA